MPMTAAGIPVNEETAQTYGAFYACVTLISKTIASLPLITYRRLDRGKEKAVKHPLFRRLRFEPNPEMSAFRYWQTVVGHLLTWGNAYSHKVEGVGRGQLTLWPLLPDRMKVTRAGGSLVYLYRQADGTDKVFSADKIFHIPYFGYDGLVGKSPVALARQSIALGLATQQHGASFFGNGSMPGGVLTHPGQLTKEAKDALRESWTKLHGGAGNKHRVAVLEEGLSWQSIGISNEDSQFLQTRRFQVEEVARFFGIPLHKIQSMEQSTNNNIEHQNIEFVVDTIRPPAVLIEQEIQRSLIPEEEKDEIFVEFLVDALLRGDSAARGEFYTKMFNIGAFSQNDVLEKENMNPIEDGDRHYVPLNMVPIDAVDEMLLPEEAPALDDDDEQNAAVFPYSEARAQRSAQTRRRMAVAYKAPIEKAFRKVVRSEIREVRKAVDKFLLQRDARDFRVWLDDFYREHRSFIRSSLTAVFALYAAEVRRAAAAEVAAPVDSTPDFDKFVEEFVATVASRHAISSRRQILALIEGEASEIAERIQARMDEWEQKRPEKEARKTTHEAESAFAIAVYVSVGIRFKRWVSFGKTCPYCSSLNGKRVDITQAFFSKGEEVRPDGQPPMRIGGLRRHPPLHGGCDCSVVASL